MIRARQISPTKGKKRSILFLLWVFTGICGLAQTTIEGTIRDSIGDPVAYANIFIHESNDPTILAFTYSNNEGYYHIVFEKTGSFILNASSLTHTTKQLPLEINEQPSGKILRDITMQAQLFSLNEVIVNADIPILVKKDTIVINAESFVDGTEDVLEDVLKKLPGIDVTDDGTIQVQGKDVEKVIV
jgi:hypothetical protein